jgi:hypothetical protein
MPVAVTLWYFPFVINATSFSDFSETMLKDSTIASDKY